MRAASRFSFASACLLALAALLAGCGGGANSSTSGAGSEGGVKSRPAPPKSEFPSASGRSLGQVLKFASGPSELVISPAGMVFYRGQNRYPFGVFQRNRTQATQVTQVTDAEVALYLAKVPAPAPKAKSKAGSGGQVAKAQRQALNEPAIGPFPAKIESLATKPAFRAKTTIDDPNAASVVYSSEIDFPSEGQWRIAVLVKQGGELKGTLLPSAAVGEFKDIPQPGQPAPRIHTPTAAEAGGDLAKITTRIPPDTQNRVDYAKAIGKEPILLLFATPQFCQSRVCGPVVDVAEQVKQETGDKAAFIHMEIYKENDPSKGVRSQVRAFHLPSEPWLFAINRQGRVSAAVEGAFGLEKMDEVVKKVTSE
jgi:hypothetical protein